MISKDIIKQAVSVGDLFDKYLVNKIKIDRIKDDVIRDIIREENKNVMELVLWLIDGRITDGMQHACDDLYTVLQKQWDVLDGVRSDENSDEQKGKLAIVAQNMNRDRVQCKNRINFLAESPLEFKKYGSELI